MDRRSFLLGTGVLAVSQLLIGCNDQKKNQFNVQLLRGSIPGQVVSRFRKSLGTDTQLKFTPIDQIENLFHQLQTWRRPQEHPTEGWTRYLPFTQNNQKVTPADLVTLGDYWLQAAIQQELIQPLEIANSPEWSRLNQKWRELVQRDRQGNLSPQGQIWGAPYRWSNTVMVYNHEKFREFDWRPIDWSDLWRSQLRSRISLLDQPREVIGLVLKKLGKSYNTEDLSQIPALETELEKLNQQVKFYDSRSYLEPLITGDTWLAVGWSDDIVKILGHYPQLTAVVPQSGTAISADLWVRPLNQNKNSATSYKWIDFCWEGNIAKQIALLTKSSSPIFPNIVAENLPNSIQSLLLNDPVTFDKSEFLLPLSPAAINQYEALFLKIKNIG